MIGVQISGRLGNQMFQYAFVLATSKNLTTSFFLYEREYSTNDLREFFELKNNKPSLASKLRKKLFYWFENNDKVVEISVWKSYQDNKQLLKKNNCLYKGYFQSESYFKKNINLVKKEFTIKEKHLINVREFLGIQNEKPILTLHVRRTDYLIFGNEKLGNENLALPTEYYKTCLQKIKEVTKYNIVFVTDDPVYVKNNFYELAPIISSNKSAIIDFQVLMAGDKIVVANSSFSWWAAYLSTTASKIFAPKYWLGFIIKENYPADIIPDNWESIEF